MYLCLRILIRQRLDARKPLDIVADLPVIRYPRKVAEIRIDPVHPRGIILFILLPKKLDDLLSG